jgi:hypothetical protein
MRAVAANLLDDSTLRSCMLFRALTDEERAELVARAPTRTFAPGETIFLMGSYEINLTKALGLTIPPTLLALADEVIE